MRLKTMIFLSMIFLNMAAGMAAQSMSKSCSGTILYCDEYGICSDENFYIYAYQYVKFSNGKLVKHRHRFNFKGELLGKEKRFNYSGQFSTTHMIYEGDEFFLEIPWSSKNPINLVDKYTNQVFNLCP